MTSYINGQLGRELDTVQYDIDALTADVRKNGSLTWRTNNPTLIPFNLSAKQNNAIGRAANAAIFNNEEDGRNAFFAELDRPYYQRRPLAKAIKAFLPDYVIPPAQWDEEKKEPILPWLHDATGMDLNEPVSDKNALYDFICSELGWRAGIVERIEKDQQQQAQQVSTVTAQNVLINGKTAVHSQSSGVLNTVDVCLTTVGNSVIPIPYANVARSSDVTNVAQTVKVNGNGMAHISSYFSRSTGDEAGDKKGVVSGTTRGKAQFLSGSHNVFIEGSPAARQSDLMVSNNCNTPISTLTQPGAPMTQELRERLLQSEAVGDPHKALTALMLYAQGDDPLPGAGKLALKQQAFERSYLFESGSDNGREQHVKIPSVDEPCQLDLRLPCANADDVVIPCGFIETQSLEEEKQEAEKTGLMAILPQVFTQTSLSKATACAPDYIENLTGLPAHAACGYLYIFVDGYLWRELACLGDNKYSDVDLQLEHSKDVRKFRSRPTEKILIPTRTRGLYHSQAGLQSCRVEIAFSRVQWSWQYICDLGGMFETDQRFTNTPLMAKCMDAIRAARLRGERCQLFDFADHTNPTNCDYVATENGQNQLYLHDMIGIAQRHYLHLDTLFNLLEVEYSNAKDKPYYDSALLAYQLYLNEKLHKRAYDYQRGGYHLVDQSSEADDLRDIAALLDGKEIEKVLISDFVLEVLDLYLEKRVELADFFNEEYEKEALSLICDRQNIHAPTNWHYAVRDLSTLPVDSYAHGLLCMYNILNRLTEPMKHLPVFIKAIDDGHKKYVLKDRMKKIERKTYQIMKRLALDEHSWLRSDFCADENAFGDNLVNSEPKPSDPGRNPGIFDPHKLKQTLEKAVEPDMAILASLVLGAKVAKASSSLSIALLTFWKNNLIESLKASDNATHITFKVVGPTLKSMGTDVFKKIEITNFGQIPPGYVMLGNDIVEHTLFNKPRYRGAKKALENAIDALNNGREVDKKDLRIIEKYAPHGTHTSTNGQRNVVVTDRKTGAEIGVTTRAGARELIQKGLDMKGFLEDLRTLEIKVFIVPESEVPSIYAHQIHQENPIGRVTGLRLNKVGRASKRFHNLVPGALFLIDLFTTSHMYDEYKKNFEGRGNVYSFFKNLASLSELMVAGAQVFESYISSNTLMSKELAAERSKVYNKSLSKMKHSMKITRLTIVGGTVGIVSAGVTAWDAWRLFQKQDNDAAVCGAISAGLGLALGLTAIIGLAGPVVWALMLGTLAFGILSSKFENSDVENWAEFGPFSANKTKRLTRFLAFKNSRAYYNFITSVLMSPSVKIDRIAQSNNFIIYIHTPLYDELESDVYIHVSLDEDRFIRGGWCEVKKFHVPINHTFKNKKINHKIEEPTEIKNEHDKVIRLEYEAYFNMRHVDYIYAKASLVHNGLHLPQNLKAYENITDEQMASGQPVEQLVNQPAWAKDKYSNQLFSRIADDIVDLFE